MITDGAGARPGWLLDEMTCVGRENLDELHVSRYDEKEDASAASEVHLLQSAGLGQISTVVDLGAGTGQFALAAAKLCQRVIAVDPSPIMLSLLREKARNQSASLEIVQSGFLTYQHSGDPPDVVYSRFALHHLPDFWKAVALGRIRRMLRPGGSFASGTSCTISESRKPGTGSSNGAIRNLRMVTDGLVLTWKNMFETRTLRSPDSWNR